MMINIIMFFLLGLILGSFLNVVGIRLPLNEPFIQERSRCPTCKKILSPFELIPFVSFFLQRGKCKNCQQRISPIYPFIELFTASLFTISYIKVEEIGELLIILLLISMLNISFVSDIKYMIIPNKLLIFFLPLLIVMRIIYPLSPWYSSILGAFIGFLVIALIIFLSNGGMGAGDMKLLGVIGIVLGVDKTLVAFLFACIFGSIIGILLLTFQVISRKQPMPFGPFIVAGTLIAYFYGDLIIYSYMSYF